MICAFRLRIGRAFRVDVVRFSRSFEFYAQTPGIPQIRKPPPKSENLKKKIQIQPMESFKKITSCGDSEKSPDDEGRSLRGVSPRVT